MVATIGPGRAHVSRSKRGARAKRKSIPTRLVLVQRPCPVISASVHQCSTSVQAVAGWCPVSAELAVRCKRCLCLVFGPWSLGVWGRCYIWCPRLTLLAPASDWSSPRQPITRINSCPRLSTFQLIHDAQATHTQHHHHHHLALAALAQYAAKGIPYA